MFSLHIDTAETWRGGQAQLLLTAQGLAALGHRVAVVLNPNGELRRRLPASIETFPLVLAREMDLAAAWQLSRLLRQLRPDIVHAHDSHAVAGAALALSIGAPKPRPALVAARRVDFHIRGNSFSRWKHRQVDRFVAASEAIRRMLIEDGVAAERVVTVHDGIDVERVEAAPMASVHAALWLPAQVPVVGNVAALVPHKGQKYLVEAAPRVVRQVPDAHIVIFGDGELRGELERQVKELHVEKRVILAGFDPNVLGLLKSFDVFVMSSVTEGLGTALLDAMAAARPIVATRAGGIPEVIEDDVNGLLVPPRDAAALADAIVRLLHDAGLRARLAAAGLARVRREFSAARMVAATARVYEDVAGTARGAGSGDLLPRG
jgi:glycosyltransferase involved in cell wall biosynthesis